MSFRTTIVPVLSLLVAVSADAKTPRNDGPFYPTIIKRRDPQPPWRRRRRVGVKVMKGKGQGLIDLKRWPPEPRAPRPVDEERLGQVLRKLCGGWMPPKRPFLYARWIVTYARGFQVDPFLLAALVYRQSRCVPRMQDSYGMGLAMINPGMHGPYIRKRRYRYHVLEGAAWSKRELSLPRFAFVPGNIRRSEPGIYFAAALLRVWKEQCPAIDGAFGSVPHRHFVSHFIWGDRVKGAGAEDRVLRSRRRLIAYYLDTPSEPLGRFEGLPLHCPLEAPPRKVTSGMGSDRADGRRFHKGVDFSSTLGEPVHAVADGKVVLAGLDRRQGGPVNVDPEATKEIKRSQMGPGGLFVMIRHEGGLLSAYMHLASYVVKVGQSVKGAEVIGLVGKTGIKESGPHLHFELRRGGRHIDPMPHIAPFVFPPDATYIGRRVAAEERRIRRKRRRARRRKAP